MSTAEITTLTKQNADLQKDFNDFKKEVQKDLLELKNDVQHDMNGFKQSLSNLQPILLKIEQGLFGDEIISHIGAIKELQYIRTTVSDLGAKVSLMQIIKDKEDALKKNDKGWIKWLIGVVSGGVVYLLTLAKEYFIK